MPVADLIIYGSSADRSAADVNIPVNSGETQITITSSLYGVPKYPGAIVGAFVNSETAAMVETWFKKRTAQTRNKLATTHLQTDPLRTQIMNYLNYPISPADEIEAAGENAGAVLDVLGLYFAQGGEMAPTPTPPGALPAGAMIVDATGATTLAADVLSAPGAITFVDFVPERDVVYKILGMAMHGGSACASRIRFLDSVRCPGVPAADTSTGLEYMMWYGDFGSFKGQDGIQHQTIGVGADTAQLFKFLIVPTGTGNR